MTFKTYLVKADILIETEQDKQEALYLLNNAIAVENHKVRDTMGPCRENSIKIKIHSMRKVRNE